MLVDSGGTTILGSNGVAPAVVDVVDAFTEVVARSPEHPAIVHNGHDLSYAQLDVLVRETGLGLGREPGAEGVCTPHSPDVVVGFLGGWAVGRTYCPALPG